MSSELDYFDKVVMQYSKGDVEALIGTKINKAGPLLVLVLNGIDLLGGMCYDFFKLDNKGKKIGNSRERSTKFMTSYMGISQDVAEFLYKSVRCGIIHQGQAKYFVNYFVDYDPGDIEFLYKENDILFLNAFTFASKYLEVVAEINKNKNTLIKYIPSENITAINNKQNLGYQSKSYIKQLPQDLRLKFGITGVSGYSDSTSASKCHN